MFINCSVIIVLQFNLLQLYFCSIVIIIMLWLLYFLQIGEDELRQQYVWEVNMGCDTKHYNSFVHAETSGRLSENRCTHSQCNWCGAAQWDLFSTEYYYCVVLRVLNLQQSF